MLPLAFDQFDRRPQLQRQYLVRTPADHPRRRWPAIPKIYSSKRLNARAEFHMGTLSPKSGGFNKKEYANKPTSLPSNFIVINGDGN